MGAEEARFCGADDRGKGIERGFADALDALEIRQKKLLGGRADSFDCGKLAYYGRL